ncbi:MAG: YihY/virulence factor BrkB family protein [Firmicutes bacterium]|nr:YihY/virulence factor BrkB family protein [Bacillota bacterium]
MQLLRRMAKFLVEVYNKFNEHNGFLLAAGIAFFTFFSIFPLLLFTGIALGYVLEGAGTLEKVLDYVFQNLPTFADFVRVNIEALIKARSSAGIIALIALLWSGTNIFGSLALGLNAVYEVKETRSFAVQKLIAVGVFVLILVLLFVSFGTTTIASVFRDEFLSLLFPQRVVTVAWTIITAILSLISTFLLFLVVYWLVPNVRLTLGHIWPGTLTAGVAWEAGKYVFAVYLDLFARRGYGLVYGSLATVILLMFWLYISAVLLLIGAEINVAYRRRALGGVKAFEPRKGSQDNI